MSESGIRKIRPLNGNKILRQRVAELEQKLAENEEKFRAIADYTFNWETWIDNDGRLLWVNPAVERITGYTVEECLNMSDYPLPLIHPGDSEKVIKALREGMNGGLNKGFSFRVRRKDGSIVWVEACWQPSFDAEGKRLGYRSSFCDITTRKRAEEEQRQLEAQVQYAQKLESLGVLAGGIAHDFNNLLAGILGNAELVLMGLPKDSSLKVDVEQIIDAANRAADLTDQMLAYSGKGAFVVRSVDISALAEEMANLLKMAVSKKTEIRFNFTANLPTIIADANQIRQVMINLVTNASEAFGNKSGVITVSTGFQTANRDSLENNCIESDLPEGRCIYFEVSDAGCGMDEETKARIFDPFFTTKFAGRGLGLAAVQGIVRGHGGAIKIKTAPDKGSVFRVLFPVPDNSSETDITEASHLTEHKQVKVLVVDDENTVRHLACKTLESSGYDIVTARDGREVVDVFGKHKDDIDIILLDMLIPQMNGREVLAKLRGIKPQVRVILTSGYTEEVVMTQFAANDLDGFLKKPYKPTDLLEKVKRALSSAIGGRISSSKRI